MASKLSIEEVEAHWRKVNRLVSPQPFIKVLWMFCRKNDIRIWKKLFGRNGKEAREVIDSFVRENGFVLKRRGNRKISLAKLRDYLIPLFNNRRSKECGFIASLMMKFKALLYPTFPINSFENMFGKQVARAMNLFESTSKWCLDLDIDDFEED